MGWKLAAILAALVFTSGIIAFVVYRVVVATEPTVKYSPNPGPVQVVTTKAEPAPPGYDPSMKAERVSLIKKMQENDTIGTIRVIGGSGSVEVGKTFQRGNFSDK